jgi:outer membrane lipoprotein-sorting protein
MNRWMQACRAIGPWSVALALCAGLSVTSVRAQSKASEEKLPPAEELMAKSIEAQGGAAAYEKLKTRVMKGTFEIVGQNVKGPMVTYNQAPNKQYSVIDLENFGKVESGADGEVAWEVAPATGPRVLQGYERALSLREAALQAPIRWKDFYKKIETAGTDKVDDRPVYKLVMTPNEGAPETVYLDAKTYLAAKAEFKLSGPMGDVQVVVTFDDYRKTDGINMPMRARQVLAGGAQTVEITVNEVQYNVDIPADKFKLPAAVQALVDREKAGGTQPASGPNTPKKDEPKKDKP